MIPPNRGSPPEVVSASADLTVWALRVAQRDSSMPVGLDHVRVTTEVMVTEGREKREGEKISERESAKKGGKPYHRRQSLHPGLLRV